MTYSIIDHRSISLTAENRLCTDDYVDDEDVCKKTVSQLEDQYLSVKFSGNFTGVNTNPPGCFLYVKKHVYFNWKALLDGGTSGKNPNSQHICWEGSYIE